MKKTILRFVLIAILIGIVLAGCYFMINLKDEALTPGAFGAKDLLPVRFGSVNGFYYLWNLGEPPEIDILSRDNVQTVRTLFDPAVRDAAFFDDYSSQAHRAGQVFFSKWLDAAPFPAETDSNWFQRLETHKSRIEEIQAGCQTLLWRYQWMLAAPEFADLTFPDFRSPLPALTVWRATAKLNTAIQLFKAMDGDWKGATEGILRDAVFAREAAVSSRTLIMYHAAVSVMTYSMQALVEIMNRPDCPSEVFRLVRDGLPPLDYSHFSCRNALVGECLSMFAAVDYYRENPSADLAGDSLLSKLLPVRVFFHKNRTKNYFFAFFSAFMEYVVVPPYQWRRSFKEMLAKAEPTQTGTAAWWVRNPLGRLFFDIAAPDLHTVVFRSWELKTKYDLVILLAEFHRSYTPGKTAEQALAGIPFYLETIDLCSGKPYRWNPELSVFYGIGPDCADNGGNVSPLSVAGSDVAVFVRFPGKGE